MTRNNGFGVIGIILSLAIIAVVSSGGYYVYKNSVAKDNSNKSDGSTKKPDVANYIYKEFGFSFQYPNINGSEDPIVHDTTANVAPVLGKSYSINIDPKFIGGFVTNNFAMAPDKVDEMPLGFSVYNGCNPDDTVQKQAILYKSKDVCVVVNASEELAPGSASKSLVATMVVQKKFTKNDQIAGLEFARAPVAIKSLDKAKLKLAYGEQVNNDSITFVNWINVS